MKIELENLAAWFIGIAVAVFLTFKVIGAMQHKDDSRISLAKYACPMDVARQVDGSCIVTGSLSHNFVSGEVEITLPDKSQLLVRPQDVRGYSTPVDHTRYEPFGRFGALLVGLLIAGFGFCIAVVFPAWSSRKRADR